MLNDEKSPYGQPMNFKLIYSTLEELEDNNIQVFNQVSFYWDNELQKYSTFEFKNLFDSSRVSMDRTAKVQFSIQDTNVIYKSALNEQYQTVLLAAFNQKVKPQENKCEGKEVKDASCVVPARLVLCPKFHG